MPIEMEWEDLSDIVPIMVARSKEAAEIVYTLGLPVTPGVSIHYDPFDKIATVGFQVDSDEDAVHAWIKAAHYIADGVQVEHDETGRLLIPGAVKIARAPQDTWIQKMLESLQLRRGESIPGTGIPNAPSLAASMLAGGLLGGTLGYGAGALGETLLPERWERGKLRRSMAMTGAGLGAAPGFAWGVGKTLANDPDLFGGWFDNRGPGWPELPMDKNMPIAPVEGVPAEQMIDTSKIAAFAKEGGVSNSAFGDLKPIDVDALNREIWGDPRLAQQMSVPLRAMTSGAVSTAANLGGSSSAFVTPMDMARLSASMGSGYMSGLIVGKALGALTGAPQDVQDKLKQTGLYAGLIKGVVPMMFQ